MMKHLITLFSACVLFMSAGAQSDSLNCAREINQQVWKPFITHLTSGNKESFKSLHSKRITRVLIDNNTIQDYDKYFPSGKENRKPAEHSKRLFELRFDKRICNGTKAWETGYYKGTVLEEGKDTRYYYGRFTVVLEKENEGWKIIVDADTGANANEENFRNANPME